MKVGGRQCIRTPDGYIFPLDIENGLPYLKMEKHTNEEWKTLPHVVLTSPGDWNPRVLDNIISDKEDWTNTIQDLDEGLIQTPFDEFGNYKKREPTPVVQLEPDPTHPDEEDRHEIIPEIDLDADYEVDLLHLGE